MSALPERALRFPLPGDGKESNEAASECKLFAVIADTEEAFQQLHQRFMLVKEAAQDMQMSENQTLESSMGTKRQDDTEVANIEAKPSSGAEGFVDGPKHTFGCTAEEPHALSVHRQRRADPIQAVTSKASFSIRASGFTEAKKHELRLNVEWMELAAKSNRMLESAASGRSRTQDITRGVSAARDVIDMAFKFRELGSVENSGKGSGFRQTFTDLAKSNLRQCYKFLAPISPHSVQRICWDVAGCIVLILDAFILPIIMAWDIELTSSTAGTWFLWMAIVFWSLDMLATCNTACYKNGELRRDRWTIMKNYFTGWFILDLLVVGMDWLLALAPMDDSQTRTASMMRGVRSLRFLRIARFLRALKLKRFFNDIVEEAALASGRPWLLIVVSIFKIMLVPLVAGHMMSCLWYFVGRYVHDRGRVSWLSNMDAVNVDGVLQYMHALQWLLTPPSPAPIEPASSLERLGNIFIITFTLFLMGSALGKFTSAMQDLNAINSERTRKRRDIRSYLHVHSPSMELVSRIMRFVDYKLAKQNVSPAVDISLVSPALQMELYVSQRSGVLLTHPLFGLTMEAYPDMYANMCGIVIHLFYEKDEHVFQAGEFANQMTITAAGSFSFISTLEYHSSSTDSPREKSSSFSFPVIHTRSWSLLDARESDYRQAQFSEVRWFSESSVFTEGMIHSVTLRSECFCEVFSVTCQQLVNVARDSPGGAYMFCEYAKDFLTALENCENLADPEKAQSASQQAAKQNQHYIKLHPDPKLLIENFRKDSSGEQLQARRLIQLVMDGHIRSQMDLTTSLRMAFFELDPECGSHHVFSEEDERLRAESSCLSILNLVADQYENFTSPQDKEKRLSQHQWLEIREIIDWISPTPGEIHTVVVLLAIRTLGKSKQLVQQCGMKSHKTPESVLRFLIRGVRNVVPSVDELDEDAQKLLTQVLRVHEKFNFAQMLQGENCPANVLQLKDSVQGNIGLFKFFILFLIGFTCGLAGGEGSTFMNSEMAGSIIAGCRVLSSVIETTPQAIYWNYMVERARLLSVPTETPNDLALTRLACLSRVRDRPMYLELQAAWYSISATSRNVLLNHFLADGITERAFVLEFFPSCISNAKGNKSVKLPALLDVIVDLLDNLTPVCDDDDVEAVFVNLSDLAEFTAVVQNRFVFLTCISRSEIRRVDDRIFLEMSASNWNRTDDRDADLSTIAHDVKRLLENFDHAERCLSSAASLTAQRQRSNMMATGQVELETALYRPHATPLRKF